MHTSSGHLWAFGANKGTAINKTMEKFGVKSILFSTVVIFILDSLLYFSGTRQWFTLQKQSQNLKLHLFWAVYCISLGTRQWFTLPKQSQNLVNLFWAVYCISSCTRQWFTLQKQSQNLELHLFWAVYYISWGTRQWFTLPKQSQNLKLHSWQFTVFLWVQGSGLPFQNSPKI